MINELTFEQFAEVSRHCVDGNPEGLDDRQIKDFLYTANMLGVLASQDSLVVTLRD
jgi:hypothetical protein